jgi:hypothetical protein
MVEGDIHQSVLSRLNYFITNNSENTSYYLFLKMKRRAWLKSDLLKLKTF